MIQYLEKSTDFGTIFYDLEQKSAGKDVPIDKGLTEIFKKAFENTILGKIEGMAEEDALDTASGRITQALVQLFGAARIAKKTAIPAVEKISQKTRQLVNAIKNKMVSITPIHGDLTDHNNIQNMKEWIK